VNELRITDTNSANDSKGRAFGLEGNNFLYLLVAFVVALGLYIVVNVVLHVRMVGALGIAIPFFLLPTAWVLLLRHNKPEGYASDLIDNFINKEGWSYSSRSQPNSPL